MMLFPRFLLSGLMSIAAATAYADVKVQPLIGDNMVLQRDASVRLWGTANPGEDTDGDGLVNLVELFMGLDPEVSDSSGAFDVVNSGGFLRIVYRRARNTAGTMGVVEYSVDLENWSTTGVTESIVSDVPGEDYVLVEARVAALSGSTAYLRLRVTQ